MKNIITPILLCLLTITVTFKSRAATVDVNTAKTIAANFYSSNSNSTLLNIGLVFTETATDGSPAYYVFNINSNDGFVIITADDAAMPIIGYATAGHYNFNKVVPPLAALLKDRAQQISYIKLQHLPATQKIKQQWQNYQTGQGYTRSTASAIGPLCNSAWNQQTFYNNLCPGNSPTGCTATTMAQIMKYWSYPAHGTGSFSYTDSIVYGFTEDYGVQSADFGNTTYNWAAMPNTVTSDNAEIDTLMYQCGVSIGMDYNPILGSNSNVTFFDSLAWRDPCGVTVCAQTAFAQYFGYDSASMQGLQKSNYTDEVWDSILESELNNDRLIQYAGYTDDTKQEGHTWVCDGYNVNNFFHMNWGWGGDYDGYFNLDNLHTDVIYNFDYAEEALIGIQPTPSVATAVKEPSLEPGLNIYPNPTTGKVIIYSPQVPVTSIEVYNLLGEKILESNNQLTNNSAIDLSSQPVGVYVILLHNAGKEMRVKVVKE